MNPSQFTMDMKLFRAAMNRMSYAIEHTIISGVHERLAAFHFYFRDNTLEIIGTDGVRIAWQHVQVEGEGQFDAAVFRRDLEQALKSMKWQSCEVSVSEDGSKIFFIDPSNIANSTYLPTVKTWERDDQGRSILQTTVLRQTVRAEASFMLSDFRALLAHEKTMPPLTYPGMDNHDLAFVYINSSGLSVRIGSKPDDPHAVCVSVSEKHLSCALRFLSEQQPCSARISSARSGELMLILQDDSGGHAIVALSPLRTVPLGAVHEGYSFRVPGSPATFRLAYGCRAYLQHGSPSAELLAQRMSSDVFSFSPYLEVFLETTKQSKDRSRNNRPYSYYPPP